MAEATSAQIFKRYRKRFNYFGEYQIEETPDKDVKYRIVIPCFNEPNLTATLKSLLQCEVPSVKIEVIVVLNQSSDANEAITSQNLKTLEEFSVWNKRDHSAIEFFIIKALDLPPKKAGVGLARKIGMDESLRRFGEQDKIGHIICLDADCLVSTNYLKSIEKYLTLDVRGGHFYFEHEFLNIENQQLREGIVNYELHLRYYAQALKYAGFSKWHHTVGSCMIVRSDIYAKQGGMNQRKAGEDFYFMHKILGADCINVPEAIVYPSARISDRVPFGTGKAQGEWLTNKNTTRLTYAFESFVLMKNFFDEFYQWSRTKPKLPKEIEEFLEHQKFMDSVAGLRKNSSSFKSFYQNLYQYIDGFFVLKMVHFLRDQFFPEKPLETQARLLLNKLNIESEGMNTVDLLMAYRKLDRDD